MEGFRLGKWLELEQEALKVKVDGGSLIDLTAYQDVALWWFIRFRLFNRAATTTFVRTLTRNTNAFSLANFLYDFLTAGICKIITVLFKKETRGRRPTVLITVHDRDWKNMRSLTGREEKGDIFYYSIIRELQKKGFRIITVTPLGRNLVSGLKTMIGRMSSQRQDFVHREFNSYWYMKIWKMEHDAKTDFRNTWKNVSKDGKLIESLKKFDLESELPYYFDSIFAYVAKCLQMAQELVAKENPDFILLSSEHGIIQKSIMVAGKLKRIPTMALQHGTIGHIHKGYLSWKGSVSESGSVQSPFCPIPDKTAVFGPYYADLLTEASAYPPSSVVATGQPRYDHLVMASKVYDREEFCGRLNLDPTKKVVLIATENIAIADGRFFLRSVLGALQCFPELQTVIKPHPAESDWYTDVVKEMNAKAVILSRTADTYEALYACDLFIAGFSTVILEAIILGKLGVTAYFFKGMDPTPYFRDVTLRVYREEDLAPAIRKALYDEKVRKTIKAASERFVLEHAYKQDGKATERVTSLIEEMMEKRT